MIIRCLECTSVVEATVNSTKSKPYRILEFLDRFIDSGAEMAVVTGWESEYASMESARNSFISVIKRASMEDQVHCASVQGTIYLIRQ